MGFEENKEEVYALKKGILTFGRQLMPKLKTLTHLNLSRCEISELPDALGDLFTLQCFDLSHNLLNSLPESIGLLKALVKLLVPFNKLAELPSSFAQLDVLEELDLSHNQFRAAPECLQVGNVAIKHLDASHNHLEEWNEGPLCAYGLKVLNCSHNQLKSNPSWIWGNFCRSLESLDLSFNCFNNPSYMVRNYSLWREGVTVRLKCLDLGNCGLTSRDIHLVHQLRAVEKLDLGNQPENLRRSLVKKNKENFVWDISFQPWQCCSVLTELCLKGVGLSILPEDIDCLKALEVLDCQSNHLQWLPKSISSMRKLRILVLSNNQIAYLPDDFGTLISLEELYLDFNALGELPSTCSGLQRIEWLDLYSNQLENVPPGFQQLVVNLQGLDMENNYFDSKSILSDKVYNLRQAIRGRSVTSFERVVQNRCVGVLSQTDDCYSNSSEEDYVSDYGSFNDSGDVGENLNSEENCQQEEIQEEEEIWDLDDAEDNYYDPTVPIPRVQLKLPPRALIIHEDVLRPDSFCPSDIHPSPSIRVSRDPFIPEDGQFEDAL